MKKIWDGRIVNILSLGAGVQSSTLALMASRGLLGTVPDVAVFADTQNEPKAVMEWLDYLETQLTFPVERVTKGDLWEATKKIRISKKNGKQYWKNWLPTYSINPDGSKGHFPRKCTYDFKVLPLTQFARRFGKIPRGCKEVRIHQWIGISLDEAHRMKPARVPFIQNIFPLIDLRMGRKDCLKWLEKNGYPTPPKSACIFCPFHSDQVWLDLKNNSPEEFARVVEIEKELNAIGKLSNRHARSEFLHAKRIPLDQVQFRPQAEDKQIDLFANECEGMCGV